MVLVGFVVLARPEPSVIRAGVMGAVGLLALSTRRRQAGVPALAGAILALVVWDPWLTRSYGFALSSVATLGLLVLAQPWGAAISRRLPQWLAWLGPVIAVPVAAQAVCAPIVVPLQSSVSVVAVPANLLAAPLVAPTTVAGVAVALISVVWVGAASLLAWAAALPAMGIAWVARGCAEAPYGSVAWDGSARGAVLLGVLTVLAIGVAPWLWRQSRLRPLVILALTLLGVTWAVPTSTVGWPPPGWLVIACDVGQGDGLVVNNGSGHAIVVDTGPDPDVMDGCLRRLGVDVVDLVVLTHFHADHTDGLAGVLDGREVGEIRVSPVREPPGEAADVDRLASEAGVPVAELRGGDVLTVGGARADVWWPSRTLEAGSVANNGSVVMTLRTAGVSILFAGDMEREAAAEVVRAARREPFRWGIVDVLKVPHHGSANRDDRVLDQITGRLAIISVGEDNDYGHPAPSALTGLRRKGFHVYRTDLEGDVALVRTADGVRALGRGSGP
jgi:competence protein ComEC